MGSSTMWNTLTEPQPSGYGILTLRPMTRWQSATVPGAMRSAGGAVTSPQQLDLTIITTVVVVGQPSYRPWTLLLAVRHPLMSSGSTWARQGLTGARKLTGRSALLC